MIPCTCIDDKSRPEAIPQSKWVKKEDDYHVTYAVICLPQGILGFGLYEKPLDGCEPYSYFAASRFRFTEENMALVLEMIRDLEEAKGLDIDVLFQEKLTLVNNG